MDTGEEGATVDGYIAEIQQQPIPELQLNTRLSLPDGRAGFKAWVKELSLKTGHPWSVRSTDKKALRAWCKHKFDRPRQVTTNSRVGTSRLCLQCPARFNATYRKCGVEEGYYITFVEQQHSHQIGLDLLEQYAAFRELTDADKEKAKPMLEANAAPASIALVLEKDRGVKVLPSQIRYLRQVNYFSINNLMRMSLICRISRTLCSKP